MHEDGYLTDDGHAPGGGADRATPRPRSSRWPASTRCTRRDRVGKYLVSVCTSISCMLLAATKCSMPSRMRPGCPTARPATTAVLRRARRVHRRLRRGSRGPGQLRAGRGRHPRAGPGSVPVAAEERPGDVHQRRHAGAVRRPAIVRLGTGRDRRRHRARPGLRALRHARGRDR